MNSIINSIFSHLMFGSSYLLAPIRCSWTAWTSAVPGGSRDVRGSVGRQDWPHPVLSFSPEDRHGEQHPGPTDPMAMAEAWGGGKIWSGNQDVPHYIYNIIVIIITTIIITTTIIIILIYSLSGKFYQQKKWTLIWSCSRTFHRTCRCRVSRVHSVISCYISYILGLQPHCSMWMWQWSPTKWWFNNQNWRFITINMGIWWGLL